MPIEWAVKIVQAHGLDVDVTTKEESAPGGEPAVCAIAIVGSTKYEHRVTIGPSDGPGVPLDAKQLQDVVDAARDHAAKTAAYREATRTALAGVV